MLGEAELLLIRALLECNSEQAMAQGKEVLKDGMDTTQSPAVFSLPPMGNRI